MYVVYGYVYVCIYIYIYVYVCGYFYIYICLFVNVNLAELSFLDVPNCVQRGSHLGSQDPARLLNELYFQRALRPQQPLGTTGNHWEPLGTTGNHWESLGMTGNDWE